MSPYKKGQQKTFKIHRLVAQTFIPNPDNKPCVDHINTIRDDNRVENLRWVTHKENDNNELTRKHKSNAKKERYKGKNHPMYGRHHTEETKRKIGEANKGENNFNYGKHLSEKTRKKISEANKIPIYCIELDRIFDSIKNCADELGLRANNIGQVCRGKLKTTGGYHFKFYDKNIETRLGDEN